MATKEKWYTALVNFSTKEIVRPMEWTDKADAIHQDYLNELDAAMNVAGYGMTPEGIPIPAGDDWRAYIGETEYTFEEAPSEQGP